MKEINSISDVEYKQRLKKIQDLMNTKDFDSLIIFSQPFGSNGVQGQYRNIAYLTTLPLKAMSLSPSLMLITSNEYPILFVPPTPGGADFVKKSWMKVKTNCLRFARVERHSYYNNIVPISIFRNAGVKYDWKHQSS